MKSNTNQIKLAIKLNSRIGDLCPFCSQPTNANIHAEIVEDSSNKVVCRSCAYSISPQLVSLLNLAESARFFVNTENDFGARFETTLFPQNTGLSWQGFDENENALEVAR